MRDLESTRFGRIIQVAGACMITWGLAMVIIDAVYAPYAAPINIITLACGLWCLLRLGPRAVRQAQEHKTFMDDHRARMREFESRWN